MLKQLDIMKQFLQVFGEELPELDLGTLDAYNKLSQAKQEFKEVYTKHNQSKSSEEETK